jgi:hypothetical protein
MTKKSIISLVSGLSCLLLISTGCGGLGKRFPEKNLFHFDKIAIDIIPDEADNLPIPLLIKEFDISPVWDSLSFVYRIQEHQYQSDFYNEFIVSPATLITNAIKESLIQDQRFISMPPTLPPGTPVFRLTGVITRIYGDFRDEEHPAAILEIRITLFKHTDNLPVLLFNKTYVSEQIIESPAPGPLADGWRKALAQIIQQLYPDILSASRD